MYRIGDSLPNVSSILYTIAWHWGDGDVMTKVSLFTSLSNVFSWCQWRWRGSLVDFWVNSNCICSLSLQLPWLKIHARWIKHGSRKSFVGIVNFLMETMSLHFAALVIRLQLWRVDRHLVPVKCRDLHRSGVQISNQIRNSACVWTRSPAAISPSPRVRALMGGITEVIPLSCSRAPLGHTRLERVIGRCAQALCLIPVPLALVWATGTGDEGGH